MLFPIDAIVCPKCNGPMWIVATIRLPGNTTGKGRLRSAATCALASRNDRPAPDPNSR